ncbi:MAG TPA: N-acetylmuramoyl-L-alanine amidase [Dehalococcoidia bacterium]|nr:N-acetylmuramoyl-L-alanine amidase [Dehalococcoidia bacterium]
MARWASWLMVLSMVLWTGLTAGVGWCVFHGGSTPVAAADVVVYDVAGPMTPHQVHQLTPEQARATLPSLAPEATPTRVPQILRAAPLYALPVGPAANVQPVDPNHIGVPPTKPRAASKGVVVLDPGHGRGDPGAVHYLPDGSGRWDITEADSNMLNAELIKNELVAMGYEVYLTREDGEAGPGGALPLQFITSDLYRRVALARSVNADVFLAIHGNGATVHSISGPETWYCGKHKGGAANERFAAMIQRAMMDALHEYGYFPPDRGIKEDAEAHHSGDFCQFVVTRETPVPAALLEFLFLTNDSDAKVLLDMRAHKLMAHDVALAIDAFLKSRRGGQ